MAPITEHAEVPPEIVDRLRAVCLALPEAYEEPAWVGTRWCVRKRNFAHVVAVADGWPPAYARAVGAVGAVGAAGPVDGVGADGPIDVLTFRSSGIELDALGNVGHPFFRPPWAPNIVGLVLDAGVGWDEVAELVTESYCVLAPQNLAALVDRPGG
jgi:hypothetical protein